MLVLGLIPRISSVYENLKVQTFSFPLLVWLRKTQAVLLACHAPSSIIGGKASASFSVMLGKEYISEVRFWHSECVIVWKDRAFLKKRGKEGRKEASTNEPQGLEGVVRWIRVCLLCEPEDLVSNSQQPHKMWVWWHVFGAPVQESMDALGWLMNHSS